MPAPDASPTSTSGTRVLAIASAGNCWVELNRLTRAFEDATIHFATPAANPAHKSPARNLWTVTDLSLYSIWKLPICLLQIIILFLRIRPGWVISTGGAPGALAIMVGRLTGARTIWVESLANSQEISLSGRMAGLFARIWLTQWPHLTRPDGPGYGGKLL